MVDVPGPLSGKLFERREAAVPRAVFNTVPIFVADGEGASVTDVDGNDFIDLAGGLGVLNVGRRNERVTRAVIEQAEKFLHECFHVSMYEGYVELAERLNELTPGDFDKKTMLANSGAEAVENAVKISRYATERPAVLGFSNGFSGRTLLGMTLTAKEMPYRHGFGPFAPEVHRAPFAYCYRCPLDLEHQSCGLACADYVADMIDSQIGASQVACMLVEPVQGEGGFVVAPDDYLPALKSICEERDILYIDDEVQSGMGRTGTMFAIERYAVVPDLLCLAKSIAGGVPMGAIAFSRAVGELPKRAHSSTFGGNPLACASAVAAIGEMERLGLARNAAERGAQLLEGLSGIRSPKVREVRGLGLLVGMELKENAGGTIRALQTEGVLALGAGPTVLRYLPPLVITQAQIARVIEATARSLA